MTQALSRRVPTRFGKSAAAAVVQFVVAVSFFALAQAASAQTTPAIEYYYPAWDHYFVTAFPDEIAALDGGTFPGWVRTGETFDVYTQEVNNAAPTCRFFSTSFAPKSSHFYTPFAAECDQVKANPDWQFEGIAFYLQLTDAKGSCPANTAPLYRLYNNGMQGVPNHRYTASTTTVDQMHAKGWGSEGNGPGVIFACLPASRGGSSMAEGVWVGTTSRNETVRAIILSDGSYYILYSQPGSTVDGGVFQGTANTTGGQFASSDGVNFPISGASESAETASATTISGGYTARASLQLTLTDASGARTLTAAYVPGSEMPASLAAAAGKFGGASGHVGGGIEITMMLNASGVITGKNDVCQFQGTVTPRASGGAFDWTIVAINTTCVWGRGPITGVMYYEPPTRLLHGFIPFGSRSDLYNVAGKKL